MKKLLLCLLTLLLVFAFAACGDDTSAPAPDNGQESPTPTSNNEQEAHTHAFGEWQETQAPTCVTAGVKTRTCACGENETEAIPATGVHTYDANNVCTGCGYVLRVTVGLTYSLNNDGKSYTVTGIGSATDTEISIPAVYEEYPVTSIGDYAFSGCGSLLTTITTPNSVVNIGDSAFEMCFLTSVTISDSVIRIGKNAFSNCLDLTSVTFADPNGWYAIIDGVESSISGLSDASTAATYLKDTYANYYWRRG